VSHNWKLPQLMVDNTLVVSQALLERQLSVQTLVSTFQVTNEPRHTKGLKTASARTCQKRVAFLVEVKMKSFVHLQGNSWYPTTCRMFDKKAHAK